MISGKQSPYLTSYDLLKTLALLLMIVDHVGYYFMPDDLWPRVIGRLTVPIWFFLIGYARTRDVPNMLWIGVAILTASSLLSGQVLFPLDILFTLAIARLLIDRVMARALRQYQTFFGMLFFLFLLSFPTAAVTAYGTLGLLFAMYGFLRRHKAEMKINRFALLLFITGCALSYVLAEALVMVSISPIQLLTFVIGMAAVFTLLFHFKPAEYPGFRRYAGPLLPLLRLTGRRTLEIYIIHLLLLEAAGMALYPERFALLDFKWFAPSLVAIFRH